MKEKIMNFLKGRGGGKILFIAGIAGIALIYASSFIPSAEKKEEVKENEFSYEEYSNGLEQQVREIVAGISGDMNAVVTVTLESGPRHIYAEDKKEQNKTEETEKSEESEHSYIIVKDSSGAEHPLVVTTELPRVRGVAIVCAPIGEATAEKIKNAVMAAFDITARKIYIASSTQ